MDFLEPKEPHISDALLHLSQGSGAELIPTQAQKNTKPLLLFAASKGCGKISHEIAASYAKLKGYDFGLTLANGYEWADLDEDDAPKETKRYQRAGLHAGAYAVFQTNSKNITHKIEEGIIAGTLVLPSGKPQVIPSSDEKPDHGLPAKEHAFSGQFNSRAALG